RLASEFQLIASTTNITARRCGIAIGQVTANCIRREAVTSMCVAAFTTATGREIGEYLIICTATFHRLYTGGNVSRPAAMRLTTIPKASGIATTAVGNRIKT